MNGKDILNTQIEKVGGTIFVDDYYWSSTEYSGSSSYAGGVDFSDGYVGDCYKYGNAYRVRPLLAF